MSEAPSSLAQGGAEGDKRERSSIEFPYMGLDDAIEVARAVHSTTGSGLCHQDQLAAALKLSMASSGFRVRISTAKMFGLIDSDRGSPGVRLSDLGHRIVDPSQERGAKAESFLRVPLYSKLFELHRGKTLPPPAALERVMAEIGVAKKQTDRARQTFERSAASAGFFEFGRDKHVMPAGVMSAAPPQEEEKPRDRLGGGGGGGDDADDLDPVVAALIRKLPRQGEWSTAERVTWLKMMSMAFQMAYGPGDPIEITAPEGDERRGSVKFV